LRLAKYIAQAGYCSRREACRLIESGEVVIDGKVASHLYFVTPQSKVEIGGRVLTNTQQRVYIAYHKPVGIDCNVDLNDPTSFIHHIQCPPEQRVFAVGRLDKDSSGLLLLTNDGECCHRLLSPQYKQAKTYIVNVRPAYERVQAGTDKLNQAFADTLSRGVNVDGKLTLPCNVTIISDNRFKIVLHQGLNRQIRKMALSQGFIVTELRRTHFATIALGDLPVGGQQSLSHTKIDEILCLCGLTNSL